MKKILTVLLALCIVIGMAACSGTPVTSSAPESSAAASTGEAAISSAPPSSVSASTDEKIKIVYLLKFQGGTFQPQQLAGLQQFMADHPNVEASIAGGTTGDAVEQNRIFQDLIAQHVDVIIICPNSTDASTPIAKQARDAGIVVIGHEAAGMENLDYDVEAFDNAAFGEEMAKYACDLAGGKGEYTAFVGALTAALHNQWVDAGEALVKSQYPDIKIDVEKNESHEDITQAYQKAVELMRTYPNLNIFQGSAGADILGVGRAVQEAGTQDSTFVVGTGVIKDTAQYLETGAIDRVYLWDPGAVAYIGCTLGLKVLNNEKVSAGDDLGLDGYRSIGLDGNVVSGNAWIYASQEDIDAGKVPEWYLNM